MTEKLYDKNDNDTYIELLSRIPATDAEMHMFRDDEGSVVSSGIRGRFSVESRQKAENSVLRFPKATSVGLKHIKDMQLATLYPMSIVHRYGLDSEGLKYKQKTPVFFDATSEQFVVFFDCRFLRDVDISELGIALRSPLSNYVTYTDKSTGQTYLGIQQPQISDFRDEGEKLLENIHRAYKDYHLSLQAGEKVIVLYHINITNQLSQLFPKPANSRQFVENISTERFDLEFAVCIRFGNRYYICDKQGKLRQQSAFTLDKSKMQRVEPEQEKATLLDGIYFGDPKTKVLVLEYDERNLEIVNAIMVKLRSIHDDLSRLFNAGVRADEALDHEVEPTQLLGNEIRLINSPDNT